MPTIINLKGPFLDFDGTPLASKVFTIDPSYDKAAVDSSTHSVLSSQAKQFFTNATGDFSIPLRATDDTDLNPSGFTYHIIDPLGREYDIVVPKNSPNGILYLSDVVPVSEPNPGYTQVIEVGGAAYDDIPSLTLLFENGLI